MKFTKFGKALLISALSAGVILGVTSCVQSYSVGFLYVTGTVTAQSGSNGIISGFKIDHNTGKLTRINGLPTSSGGANPVRAILATGSRFLYVLNEGVNASGGSSCTTATPCAGSVAVFAVGGNGILTQQGPVYFPVGSNSFRMVADTSGNFLLVLDHDSPSNSTCALALGSGATSCGDITVFQVNQTTGRLTLVVNAQVTTSSGQQLTYFPVPANPIDFVLANPYVMTLSGTPTTGDSVFPYTYSGSNGQLTVSQNTSQPLNIHQGTTILSASGVVYVLANEPVTIPPGGTFSTGTYPSQILPFSVGSNGALQAQTGGIVPDDATLANPIWLIVESKGKYLYVANKGNNAQGTNPQSGIAGYVINTSPSFNLSFTGGEPWGSGAGPVCMVEDPSDQFLYTANFNDSTITGHTINPNSGTLQDLPHGSSFTMTGPATWCLVDGRTS